MVDADAAAIAAIAVAVEATLLLMLLLSDVSAFPQRIYIWENSMVKTEWMTMIHAHIPTITLGVQSCHSHHCQEKKRE